MQKGQIVIVGIALAFLAVSAGAAIVLPTDGAGSDGAFTPSDSMAAHLDLGQALTGDWRTTNGDNRRGVYDPEQWAVIFRFTEVNIPEGVEVTFINNITHAPVIWLVQGDVVINGKVNLNGKAGIRGDGQVGYLPTALTEPGPGGFRGGRGSVAGATNGSPGLGIGGGDKREGASFSEGPVVYANAGCFPLIGGSGGGGSNDCGGISGGAGGGAILIASEGAIVIGPKGAIMAKGGNTDCSAGAGSGGMIRLVADTVTVEGGLQADGGGGAYNGRIRIEANTRSLTGSIHPEAVSTVPGAPLRLLRDDATPRLTPLTLGGKPIPADPKALMSSLADIYINELGMATLVVEAENVPPSMAVTARMMRRDGTVDSPDLAETPLKMVKSDGAKSTWQGDVEVISGFSALQVHGVFPEE